MPLIYDGKNEKRFLKYKIYTEWYPIEENDSDVTNRLQGTYEQSIPQQVEPTGQYNIKINK